ncbi:hypothetical protein FOFC_19818 [Fusarium oxysporum]|nr:hypothetical protein FOFC_19818 [Fusarium oxysporum]
MSPTPKVQSGSPRRQRLKKNRNAEAGMRNRENGLFKKTNTWHHYYGGDILIFIKRPDGRIKGYESRPKLLQEFSKLPIPAHEIRGPDDIDTVTERADTPSTTAQGEKSPSSRASTPTSFNSNSSNSSHTSSSPSRYFPQSPESSPGSSGQTSCPPASPPSPPSPSPSPRKTRKVSSC